MAELHVDFAGGVHRQRLAVHDRVIDVELERISHPPDLFGRLPDVEAHAQVEEIAAMLRHAHVVRPHLLTDGNPEAHGELVAVVLAEPSWQREHEAEPVRRLLDPLHQQAAIDDINKQVGGGGIRIRWVSRSARLVRDVGRRRHGAECWRRSPARRLSWLSREDRSPRPRAHFSYAENGRRLCRRLENNDDGITNGFSWSAPNCGI